MDDPAAPTIDERSATVNAPITEDLPGSPAAEDGPVLAGRYRLLGLLGTGGMGSVYRARDLELDEIVALKMLRPERLSAPGTLARFRLEVKLARRVTHKNVARTFDISEHESERFLTMEYLDGVALSRVIAESLPSTTGALQIVREIAEGLHAAHEAGVIHLDLKPENVMVQPSGRVVITDFGIARLGGGQSSGRFELVGTPAYMAPEQVEGRSDLDARCDVYALGEVLYELLTGEMVWSGDNPLACAASRLLRDAPNPCVLRPELPASIGHLVLRLLAKDRDARVASAAEVLAALAEIEPGRTQTLPPSARVRDLVAHAQAHAHAHGTREITVAVLPFSNESAVDDYLSDGVADDLLDTLSTTPALRLRPRSMVAPFKGRVIDPREIGRELGVEIVVEGTLRRLGPDTFRLVIRVLSVADGFQLWARRFDVQTGDLLVVSDTAARAIAEALTARIELPLRKGSGDPTAVELYLRAREELRRRAYGNDVDEAIPLLEEALRREPNDPNFLSAYAIARSRVTQSRESLLRAEEAAQRATALAPMMAEGWSALATVHTMNGNFAGAVRACARALESSPHLAEAHHLLGQIMYQVGWIAAAIHRATRALTHDPLLRGPAITLAIIYGLTGDFDRAEAILLDRSVAEPPAKYIAMGSHCRLALWRRTVPLTEDVADLNTTTTRVARLVQTYARGHADPDSLAAIRAAAATAGPLFACFLAQVEAEIGAVERKTENVLAAIAFADERGLIDVCWMDRLPLFSELRGLERFQALRARVEERAAALRRVLADCGFEESPSRFSR